MSDQKISTARHAHASALKIGNAEETALKKRANLSRDQDKKSSFAKHMESRQEAQSATAERREQLGKRELSGGEQERQAHLSRDGEQRLEQRTERHMRQAQQEGEGVSATHRRQSEESGSSREPVSREESSRDTSLDLPGSGRDVKEDASRLSSNAERHLDETSPTPPPEPASEGVGSSAMEQVQQVEKMEDLQRVQQIARELVEACQVGEGESARRVMLMEVSVPGGEGSVKVRLRRDGDGIQVRLRGSDAQTTELLRKHQQSLRDEGARRGVVFKKIEIV